MIILSHRGLWKNAQEKNSMDAMHASFALGFGVETDVRDYNGELVISHDLPDNSSPTLRQFLDIYSEYKTDVYLALNIKSDGLQIKLKKILEEFQVKNYFVFDMSVPDGLLYLKQGIRTFTRQSEYEKDPSFYAQADGVWMDCFMDDWISGDDIKTHLNQNKKVCIVSPELHKREHLAAWNKYKPVAKTQNLFLCTDFPQEAHLFFNS